MVLEDIKDYFVGKEGKNLIVSGGSVTFKSISLITTPRAYLVLEFTCMGVELYVKVYDADTSERLLSLNFDKTVGMSPNIRTPYHSFDNTLNTQLGFFVKKVETGELGSVKFDLTWE